MSEHHNVIVIGDVMLDHTIKVHINRLSPECEGTLIVDKMSETYALGGAANVANGVRALGAPTELLSWTGADDDGHRLQMLLLDNKIASCIPRVQKGGTIVKTRYMAGSRQLLRVDTGRWPEDDSEKVWDDDHMLYTALRMGMSKDTVMCLVDYDKGVLTDYTVNRIMHLICTVPGNNIICVDPGRIGNWDRFSSEHTIFKANIKQCMAHYEKCGSSAVSPLDHPEGFDPHLIYDSALYKSVWKRVVMNLLEEETKARMLVMTCGAGGIVWGAVAGVVEPTHVHTPYVQLTDVTGAGDTVMAALAYSFSDKDFVWSKMGKAIDIANKAARFAVQRPGTYAVTRRDLDL